MYHTVFPYMSHVRYFCKGWHGRIPPWKGSDPPGKNEKMINTIKTEEKNNNKKTNLYKWRPVTFLKT